MFSSFKAHKEVTNITKIKRSPTSSDSVWELQDIFLGTEDNINGHFITQKQTPSGNIEFVLTKFNDGILGPACTNDGFLRLVKSVN